MSVQHDKAIAWAEKFVDVKSHRVPDEALWIAQQLIECFGTCASFANECAMADAIEFKCPEMVTTVANQLFEGVALPHVLIQLLLHLSQSHRAHSKLVQTRAIETLVSVLPLADPLTQWTGLELLEQLTSECHESKCDVQALQQLSQPHVVRCLLRLVHTHWMTTRRHDPDHDHNHHPRMKTEEPQDNPLPSPPLPPPIELKATALTLLSRIQRQFHLAIPPQEMLLQVRSTLEMLQELNNV